MWTQQSPVALCVLLGKTARRRKFTADSDNAKLLTYLRIYHNYNINELMQYFFLLILKLVLHTTEFCHLRAHRYIPEAVFTVAVNSIEKQLPQTHEDVDDQSL